MNTKELILKVSLELFAKKGFDGVSVREIAREVGVRESALYKHYKNKEDILNKIMEEMKIQVHEAYERNKVPETIRKDVSNAYKELTEQQLCEISWNLFQLYTKNPMISNFRKLLMREQFNNKIFATYYNDFFLEGVIQRQAATFLQLVKGGLFHEEDERVIALHFYGPILLLFQQYDCDPGKEDQIKDLLFLHVKAFGKNYRNKEMIK